MTRAEALGASLGLFLLPACSSRLGGNALPLGGRGRHPARGHVTTRPTLRFPAARPDGTFPSSKRIPSSELTASTSQGRSVVYDGVTCVVYDASNYAEIYDPSNTLIGQMNWSLDGSGELTAQGIGPGQTATVTTPNVSAVASAGSVAAGDAQSTITPSSSTVALTAAGSAVSSDALDSRGVLTMTPADTTFPKISAYWYQPPGGGGGHCLHGCPQIPIVKPMTAGGSDCLQALLAALAIYMLVGALIADVLAPCAVPEPAEGAYCAAASLAAGWMFSQTQNLVQQMVGQACPQ
ncbi:MAG TPA: hypothetical protein VMV82_02630 [Candidatus Dormibacteraeota bacterium]|nr:hypothetical protein [Candidatus Dormibacteraeota bacterium]